jgi:tetratricopeptide (TPR) repeat protein
MYATSFTIDASLWPFEKGKLGRQEQPGDSNLALHLAALAYHFREADRADKAIEYSIGAGKAAYSLYAYEEAASHWQAALALMDKHGGGDKRCRALLLRQLSDDLVIELVGRSKVIECMESAARLFEELGDDQHSADTHSRLGILLSGANEVRDLGRAMDHFRKAEALLATQPDSLNKAAFYVTKASSFIWTMRTKEGLDDARRAAEIGARSQWETWFWGAILSSFFLVARGEIAEGLELAKQVRERGSALGGEIGSAVAEAGASNYLLLNDPREAQAWLESELRLPRTARSSTRRAVLLNWLVLSCLDQGDVIRARQHLAEAGGTPPAELALWEGSWEESERMFSRSFDQQTASGNRLGESLSALNLAAVCRYRADYSRA